MILKLDILSNANISLQYGCNTYYNEDFRLNRTSALALLISYHLLSRIMYFAFQKDASATHTSIAKDKVT